MNTIRKVAVATVFSATVAAVLTGAALSGETRDLDTAAICAAAHWPMIPAECLEGAGDREVRYITADISNERRNMQERFEIAFQ
jgi:hypothetical protein